MRSGCTLTLPHRCQFCKAVKEIYKEVGAAFSMSKDVKVIAVNGDATQQALTKYSIRGYPTLVLFRKSRKDEPLM